jgi:hypothetical protein
MSSGVTVEESIQTSLMEAAATGEKNVESFIKGHVESALLDFYAPIKRNIVPVTPHLLKKKNKDLLRTTILKDDRKLFARMTIIAQKRELDMKEVMKYPLSTISPSLSTSDGEMFKTRKSVLAAIMEEHSEEVHSTSIHDCTIVDAMTTIHSLSKIPGT